MRAIWLTLGAVTTAIALFFTTASLYHGFADADPPTETTRRSIPFDAEQVTIRAEDGDVDIDIVPGEAGELVVQRSLRWSRQKPRITEEWDGDTLEIGAVCPGSDRFDGPICEADYVLMVPPETSVEAGTGTGLLSVRRIRGKVRGTSVSGDVYLEATSGDVYVRSGSGSVEATDLGGVHADVEVGSGDVALAFQETPTDVRSVVRVVGDVYVRVPSNQVTYNVTTNAPRVDVDVRRSDGSPRRIIAETAEGHINVCCG
ncbi:hypothetical protein [Nonomuraea lactucae]|uniref:hypothetical protein n=1 Tax=Nonomuraea lactucae TaxID=2249762 RepID=UPI000DE577E1|nr:hypothetical protein [Nonomuraea lactucae]